MDLELQKKIIEQWEEKNILTKDESSKLKFYLSELPDRVKNINNFLNEKTLFGLESQNPIKLADVLVDFSIELGVSVDYFKDARKLFNKVADRLNKKYAEES
ncbi:MAG: hypothetical protein WAR79_00250 [Melioribacteraceae bacterium]